jgi:dTMP kinase
MVKESRINLPVNYPGRILVFEGGDGTGKSAQIEKLKNLLGERKIPFVFFKFPRHGKAVFGKIVDNYLEGKFGNPVCLDPYLSASFFASDRREVLSKIKKAQKQGKLVLMDRFTGSNLAHQLAKIEGKEARRRFSLWLFNLEHQVLGLPTADWVLYFSVSVKSSLKLLNKTTKNKDGHEIDLDYLSLVKKEFDAIAKNGREWHIIECEEQGCLLSLEAVFKMVRNLLSI